MMGLGAIMLVVAVAVAACGVPGGLGFTIAACFA
jgi:hypothetical protein